MDSSINSPSTASPSTESENSAMENLNRATFLSTYVLRQQWSLPDTIIYYISKNSSSAKVHGKLIQTCKYFMIRSSPIVVNELNLVQSGDELEVAFDEELVDFNNIPSKIWLTDKLNVFSVKNSTIRNLLSILTPKICQSSIKQLSLQKQICSFNDLQFLGSKCESIQFDETVVMNEDDAIVAVEDVFQLFPNAKRFSFCFRNQGSMMVTPKTFQNLVKIPHFSNLQCMNFFQLPETFDIDCFYAYMNKNKKTKIWLSFCNELSDGYSNRLQAIVNEIVAAKSRNYKVPYLNFPDTDESVYGRMMNLFHME